MTASSEFHVNEDGSVPMEMLGAHYADAWEPDFVTVAQIREMLGVTEESINSKHSVVMGQILSMLKSLRPGAEITKFRNPMFSQKPKSVLEMIADFQSPRPKLLTAYKEQDPIKRLLAFFEQGLQSLAFLPSRGLAHNSPYNPILRERFLCKWEHQDSTTHYVAEQVSHHPPVTCTMTWNEKAHLCAWSTNATTPVFRGNYVEMHMRGEYSATLFVQDEKTGQFVREDYEERIPGMTFSGLFIGTPRMEIASHPFEITCKKTDLKLKVKFKSGGQFKGKIYRGGKKVRRLMGSLCDKCLIIDLEQHPGSKNWETHGQTFMDNSTTIAQVHMKTVGPVEQMHPLESRRVWFAPNYAIRKLHDLDTAGKYKSMIEEHQRHLRKQKDFTTEPLLFRPTGHKVDNVSTYRYKQFDQIDRLCSGQMQEALEDNENNDDLD